MFRPCPRFLPFPGGAVADVSRGHVARPGSPKITVRIAAARKRPVSQVPICVEERLLYGLRPGGPLPGAVDR